MERKIQYLPPEIIFEILARLPVKSLCRFRCVCTLWRSTILSHQFIDSHFACSSSRPALLIALPHTVYNNDPRGISFYSTNYPDRENQLQTCTNHGTLTRSVARIPRSQSLGGLVLVELGDLMKIYNPGTRETVADIATPSPEGFSLTRRCLGFDPIGKVHKVLCTFIRLSLEQEGPRRRWLVNHKVLTLDGQNKWRTVHGGTCYSFIKSNIICLDGVIYYIDDSPYEPKEQQCFIGFDVRSETFRVTKLPPPLVAAITSAGQWHLVELHGSVAVVQYCDCDDGKEIAWWVFEGFDKRQAWSCRRIALPLSWKDIELFLLGSTPIGELLFRPLYVYQPCRLFYFDMGNNRARTSEIPGLVDVLPDPHPIDRRLFWNVGLSFTGHIESLLSARDLSQRAT